MDNPLSKHTAGYYVAGSSTQRNLYNVLLSLRFVRTVMIHSASSLFSLLVSLCCKTVKYKLCSQLHFQGLIEVSIYIERYTRSNCVSVQSHRVEHRFSCFFPDPHISPRFALSQTADPIYSMRVIVYLLKQLHVSKKIKEKIIAKENHWKEQVFTTPSFKMNKNLKGKAMKCSVK